MSRSVLICCLALLGAQPAFATGVTGTVWLEVAPGDLPPDYINVTTSGPQWNSSPWPNGATYAYELPPGTYTVYAHAFWPARGNANVMWRGFDAQSVNIAPDQVVSLDFIARQASLTTDLRVSGTLRPYLQHAAVSASAREYAWARTEAEAAPDGSVWLPLVEGTWSFEQAYAWFEDAGRGHWRVITYDQQPWSSGTYVAGGEHATAPTFRPATTYADLYLRCVDAAGAPIPFFWPQLSASTYPETTQFRRPGHAYVDTNTWTSSSGTVWLPFVGRPGHYYARTPYYVGGEQPLQVAELDLGQPVPTPVASAVTVVPLDPAGAPLPMSIALDGVTSAGDTTATLLNFGPLPPEGRVFLKPLGVPFVALATDSTLAEAEIAIPIDTAGLTPARAANIRLEQFECEGAPTAPDAAVCTWTALPGTFEATAEVLRARASKLGFVAVTAPAPMSSCVGAATAPVRIEATAACGATADAASGIAGTCTDRGYGLSSCTFDGATSVVLGPGVHEIVVAAQAPDGSTDSCLSFVEVVDATPPSIALAPTPAVLWPPTGLLVPIDLGPGAADNCTVPQPMDCTAVSSEPDSAAGPAVVWEGGVLYVRAERTGYDRTYTITCSAVDAAGLSASAQAIVTVPHRSP